MKILKNLSFRFDFITWLTLILIICFIVSSLILGIFKIYILQYLINFVIGFIINYILFSLVLGGFFGINLKILLKNKIINKEMKWINIFLLLFIGFYLLILFNMNTLYLEEPTIQIKLDEVNFNIKGELINRIFNQFGGAAAFVTGAKIAASLIAKKNMSTPSKLLSSFSVGVGFYGGFYTINEGTQLLKAQFISKLENETINISVDNVQVIIDKKNVFTGDQISVNKLESFLPRFRDSKMNLDQYSSKIKEILNNNNDLKIDTKSNIISSIEKFKSQTISEIFQSQESITESVTENVPNIINAPLELTDIEKLKHMNDLVNLLQYNLIVNLAMVYLTFTLIFIITVKLITDNNINIDIVKNFPLGKYLYIILNKLISSWRISNIAWIYFMLISLFIFSCISTFGIYVCLVVLS